MADANARKAAIRNAVTQVRSGDTFTRRVSGATSIGRTQRTTTAQAKKAS
jgi:hypothetical protein